MMAQNTINLGQISGEMKIWNNFILRSKGLTICQHIPVVRKNHKNQLTQQFDIICCLARCLALCIESKQITSVLSCEPATLKRGQQLCGQHCGPYLRH